MAYRFRIVDAHLYCWTYSVNTSGRNTSEGQVADTINQTGMYSMVRHPLYVGNFIMWLGIALFTASIWFVLLFIAVYWLYYERIMYAEEQFMRRSSAIPAPTGQKNTGIYS